MELDPERLNDSLHALLIDKSRRCPSRYALDRVVLFNLVCPVGTKVRYYPIWGQWDQATIHHVSERAHMDILNEPAVLLDGVSAYVSLWHCEPVIPDTTEVAA